jgi:hypothetical protein
LCNELRKVLIEKDSNFEADIFSKVNLRNSKYFTYEESKDTISALRQFDPNERREKRASFTFNSGAVYIGEWKGEFRDGFGEQVWPDGARYIGEWSEDRANGKGKFIHTDGEIYDGQWENDKAEGFGVYKNLDGA